MRRRRPRAPESTQAGLHHRPQQALDRGSLRQGLRARGGAQECRQAATSGHCSKCHAAERDLHLCATSRGARSRPRRAVCQVGRGRRALCRAPGRRPDPLRDKGVVEQMSEIYERFGCSVLSVEEVPRERDQQVRHRQDRARPGRGAAGRLHRREAGPGQGPVQSRGGRAATSSPPASSTSSRRPRRAAAGRSSSPTPSPPSSRRSR
jgi:hypothetical protein